jgi:hypothetical protein
MFFAAYQHISLSPEAAPERMIPLAIFSNNGAASMSRVIPYLRLSVG